MGLERALLQKNPGLGHARDTRVLRVVIQIEKRHKGSANLLTDQSYCAQGRRSRDGDNRAFGMEEHP